MVLDFNRLRTEYNEKIRCFNNVGTILFTVDIAGYDQLPSEDKTVNGMHEALVLFDSIVNTKRFTNTSFALFFIKYDKLAAKLKASPLKNYFPIFKGGDDLEEAAAYITKKFVSLSQHSNKTIDVYYTSIVEDRRSPGKMAKGFLKRVAYAYSAHNRRLESVHSVQQNENKNA